MEQFNRDLVVGLHDLVANIDPVIKISDIGLENAEDILLHLEETDDNFHRNNFVKFVSDSISTEIGPSVDEEIEKRSTNCNPGSVFNQHPIVHSVTETINNSNVFSELSKQLCASSVLTATELCKRTLLYSSDDDVESNLSHQLKSMCSEGELSYSSSFNQGIFFMTHEQFHLLAEELSASQPLSKRQEALLRLCQVPPSDVMASESWSHMRVVLMDALADNDNFLSHTALSFHAKMFAVSSYQILRETYSCLCEHITHCFEPWTSHVGDELVKINNPYITRILQRLRLLNEFQCEVFSNWVRFPESFLDCILNSTFDLMTAFMKPDLSFSGIHLISLIDFEANWFRRWLHGNYGRAAVTSRLQNKYRAFLEYIVYNSMQFCSIYISQPNFNIDLKAIQQDRKTYTMKHLQFSCFVHCLSIIARLLMYSSGRSLFPVLYIEKILNVEDMLVSWIKLLSFSNWNSKSTNRLEPAAVISQALCTLCSSNAFVEECVGEQFITSLMTPIQNWLTNEQTENVKELTTLHTAEILACLTSTFSGRKLLLLENTLLQGSAAHIIAQFAQKALSSKLSQSIQPNITPSNTVIGAYIFVCRQLYNTCEGLLMLMEYQLHERIAFAWSQTSEVKHFLPNQEDGCISESDVLSIPTQSSSRSTGVWEETLLDNLLNFAATPQGLLLLQQTGAINECVAYMHSRYTKKLQVSKCEKFGYGVMVTQLASTAAGTIALQKAGFLKAICQEFWTSVECTESETRQPSRSIFLRQSEKPAQKAFTALANVLSSYQSVHELFMDKKLPNKMTYSFRDIPSSPLELLDRLVLLNSPQKYHFLLNYEQTHVFGLRLLTLLSCNLDTWLVLETQFKIQQLLLELQKSRSCESGIIIDELTIERNHLLVRTHLIGGEGERLLPSRTLSNVTHSKMKSIKTGKHGLYGWPLFSQYPIPKAYLPDTMEQPNVKKDSPLTRFLSKTKLSGQNSFNQFRSMFIKTMISSPASLRGVALIDILEKTVAGLDRNADERLFKKSVGQTHKKDGSVASSPIIAAGAKLAVQYGKRLNIFKTNLESVYNHLMSVQQSCINFLNKQQSYTSMLKITSGPYPCHDWFVSTIFLMFSGNKDKTIQFLHKLSEMLVSVYLWPSRLHASVHLPSKIRQSGILPLYYLCGHHVELLVQMELPLIYSAFRMSGYTPSQIAQHWLTQCFWNYLPWTEITHYITSVLVLGCDYQVYICISILKHLQHSILVHRQTQDLQVFLKENFITGFVIDKWMTFMTTLEEKYRNMILPRMRNFAS